MSILLMINILFIVVSGYISTKALKAYFYAAENHEATFMWGISFFAMSLVFIGYAVNEVFYIKGLAWVMNMLETFVLVCQLNAVSMSFFSSTHCKTKALKLTRIRTMLSFIVLTILFPVLVFNFSGNADTIINVKYDMVSIQVTGVFMADILIETLQVVFAYLIFCLVPRSLPLVKVAYILFVVGHIPQLFNIIAYSYKYLWCFRVEQYAVLTAIALIAIDVLRERRKGSSHYV